jgi:5,5'-dehydrodivanillate O-demethylase
MDFAHTGPGTLGGRYLRRFWQPVYVVDALQTGVAMPIRIMSEDYALYRGESGIPHVVAARCAHRGTQLSVGWVEGDCIRCLYHGWKYEGSGQCVEQPGEDPSFADRVRIASYPTAEHLGLIFAYFGEGEPPPFPPYPGFPTQGPVEAWAELFSCNFFQSWENTADEFHVAFVHSGGGTHQQLAEVPQMSAAETPYGLVRHSQRSDGKVRVTLHLMPNTTRVIVPPFKGYRGLGGWRDSYFTLVPVDDHSHIMFGMQLATIGGEQRETYEATRDAYQRELAAAPPAVELARGVLAGRQRLWSYSDHVQSVMIEDIVAQAGQGPIANRANERLGRTDVGIILMRRLWARELASLAEGRPLTEWRYEGELPEVGF